MARLRLGRQMSFGGRPFPSGRKKYRKNGEQFGSCPLRSKTKGFPRVFRISGQLPWLSLPPLQLCAWSLRRCISRRAPKVESFFESRESTNHWDSRCPNGYRATSATLVGIDLSEGFFEMRAWRGSAETVHRAIKLLTSSQLLEKITNRADPAGHS